MRHNLLNFLRPPVFVDDGEKSRRVETLHYGSIALFVSTSLLFGINLAFGSPAAKSANWILGLVALLQFVIQWLIRLGSVNTASFILLTGGWVAMTAISRNVGGIYDEAIFGYVLILLASGYLLGWKPAIAYTLGSIATLWWLAYLEMNGKLVPVVDDPYRMALDLTVVFILISLVVFSLIRTLTREITERKRAQVELQQLARTDSLTGLFNRRHFFELAEKEINKSVRYDRSLSVILLDIDLFKRINDKHGHLVGDHVLTHFGDLLHKAIRTSDTAARYGGEEFVILLPETGTAQAMTFAERLRRWVEDSPVQIDDIVIHITVSVGVAGNDSKKKMETLDLLISQADQALYQAKNAGRNQVICFEED